MLDMDIVMILRDCDTGKITKYSSGNKISGHFTIEKALEELEALKNECNKIKFYDDDDYNKLRVVTADEKAEDKEDFGSSSIQLKKRQACRD